jgi:pyrroloquinoline quinone biosynthesis protein E
MKIYFVVPDYYETRPKRCMNGWGTTFMTVTPDGTALPCHTARMLPGFEFPNVRTTGVREAWYDSDGFNRLRGTGWMKEPCASCDEREKDYGGCRCQAYLLTNDPYAADPVCDKSPHHALVTDAVARAQVPGARTFPLVFRDPRESRARSEPARTAAE